MRVPMIGLLLCVMCIVMVTGVSAEYYDFGGATITIVGQSHHPAHRFIEGDWPGENHYGTAYGLHEEAEELFNCKIEFLLYSWGEYPAALTTRVISGDGENDIWIMNNGHFWRLMPQGLFFPVNQVLPADYQEQLPGMPAGIMDNWAFAGNQYAFGSLSGGISALMVLIYNPELFDELGLPDPQALYFDGQWTWEALADIAATGSADLTGDGTTDRWGITGLGRSHFAHSLIYTNGRAAMTKDVDGRMLFTATEPDFVESVTFIRQLMDAQVALPTNTLTAHPRIPTKEDLMAVTTLGRVQQLGPEAQYAIVPLPKGPRSQEHKYPTVGITALTIPSNSLHPEGVIQLAEFLYSPEDYWLAAEEVIRSTARDRQSAQILREMHDGFGAFGQIDVATTALGPAHTAFDAALTGQRSVAAAMGEVASAVQAALDDLFSLE